MRAIAEKGTLDMAHWFEGTVHANGIAIHYSRTGGGKPPVVLSHGLTDNGACHHCQTQLYRFQGLVTHIIHS